jgi:hypothetical protein
MCTNGCSAIYGHSSFGPVFGNNSTGDDIVINSNSSVNKNSYSDFGSSFKHADYRLGSDKARSIYLIKQYLNLYRFLRIRVFNLNLKNKN